MELDMDGSHVPKGLTSLSLIPCSGLGSVMFAVGLDGLKGLFQPE